jgi:aspartate/methionine/tyrosine aminotransferase
MSNRPRFAKRLTDLRLPDRVPGSVVGLERELEKLSEGRPDLLNLTHADTKRFPPPQWVLEDFTEAARGAGKTYTPYRGDAVVRSLVAPALGRFLGREVDPESELILTPGSQAGLFTALAALVDSNDLVVLPDPDYISTEPLLRLVGAMPASAPLERSGDTFMLDLDAVEAGLKRGARLIVMSQPNNPTGTVHSEDVIREIARLAIAYDATVLADQLYSRLIFDDTAFTHIGSLEGMEERTITLLGPSKTESMSGYRVGVAVAASEVIDAMEDVLAISVLRAPAYAQHVLAKWMSQDSDFVATRVREYQQLRDTTFNRLDACQVLDVARPQGTAYMFPQVKADATDQEVATKLLLDAGVIVNPGYQFGDRGRGSFRICFAQDEEVWDFTLDRIVTVLEKLETSS